MNRFIKYLLGVCVSVTPLAAQSQIRPVTRVPMCLQYPDNKTYVPCTGVVPVNPVTGEPMSWGDAFRSGGGGSSGSSTPSSNTKGAPLYTQETVRRAHWTETKTALAANGEFTGTTHDDGSPVGGGESNWNSFSCFAWADQAGTLSVQVSTDGTNWVSIQTQSWTANTSIYLLQPTFTKYSRCKVTNGSTPQGSFVVYSAFGF